jgi:signal recognition particle subunit SRP54
MFGELTTRLEGVFKTLRGHGKLSESNIDGALKEVRRALLEADVHFKVVRDFTAAVREKSLGQAVRGSITPGQQLIKIVHDEMAALLGGKPIELALAGSPAVVMLVGLQGSGKTTAAAKLALHLRKKGRRPALIGVDIYRPAAKDQLATLASGLDLPCYSADGKPVAIARAALQRAGTENWDTLIVDTAGRLQIDAELMQELVDLKALLKPAEILYVADAMVGQDAVNVAGEFHGRLGVTGVIFSKTDGDARGGAALSIRAVTGIPVKFVGTGEKPSDFEVFYPERMASRILGMGDVVTLVERAQEAVDAEEAEKLARKLQKAAFTFEDFQSQLRQLKKMGPLSEILGMLPGMGGSALKGLEVDDHSLTKVEAMIQSMTGEERRRPEIINGSRRRRIATGSGTSVQDVNKLLKQFAGMQKMVKAMSHGKGLPGMPRRFLRTGG